MKHAYLVIAHSDPVLLKRLIELIDDHRNDIFIHIDKKSDIRQFSDIHSSWSKLTFIKRKKVCWGHYSQIETELRLMQAAHKKGPYAYYHLLSGVDLPLQSQDFIHDFFERNSGAEFIHVLEETPEHQADIEYKNTRWFIFQRFLHSGNRQLAKLFYLTQRVQSYLPISRTPKQKIYKGSNWFSITDTLVEHVLNHKKDIRKAFRWSCCCDEFLVQTFAMNSEFAERISPLGNLREIDWTRGNPYIWRSINLEELQHSHNLFARKFSSAVDSAIIDHIYNRVKTQKTNSNKS